MYRFCDSVATSPRIYFLKIIARLSILALNSFLNFNAIAIYISFTKSTVDGLDVGSEFLISSSYLIKSNPPRWDLTILAAHSVIDY